MTRFTRSAGLLLVLLGCYRAPRAPAPGVSAAIPVRIVHDGSRFQLLRGGSPYYVRGAVGDRNLKRIVQAGANSVRASPGSRAMLDSLHALGLSVLYDLPVAAERNGMNYDDPVAVRAQLERVLAVVREKRDHPAIIIWVLGNELDHIPGNKVPNWRVFDAVQEMAVAIHREDPGHPVMTVLGMGMDEKLRRLRERAPALDLLGVNTYADIGRVRAWLAQYEWSKPYMITEWGPSGAWQVRKTAWGRPIEETEAEKADGRRDRYVNHILANRDLCLGSYSFLWWQHQETTHTWYGMFDEQDRSSESVDVLQHLWTGSWPANRAPRMESVTIDERSARDNVTLRPRQTYRAAAVARDPDGDRLRYAWEVLREPDRYGAYAGGGEVRQPPVPNTIPRTQDAAALTFTAPPDPGQYRLYVYAFDDRGHYAAANLPFLVE